MLSNSSSPSLISPSYRNTMYMRLTPRQINPLVHSPAASKYSYSDQPQYLSYITSLVGRLRMDALEWNESHTHSSTLCNIPHSPKYTYLFLFPRSALALQYTGRRACACTSVKSGLSFVFHTEGLKPYVFTMIPIARFTVWYIAGMSVRSIDVNKMDCCCIISWFFWCTPASSEINASMHQTSCVV